MQELQQFKVKKVSIHFYGGSHLGEQKNAFQAIFACYIIKKFLGPYSCFYWSKELQICYRDTLYDLIGHVKISDNQL